MAKKVIQLTEEELKQLIKESTLNAINEMDATTYSRIHNASHRAKNDIQNGSFTRTVNGKKIVDNDDIITRAYKLEPSAQAHWLKDYIGKTFKFFGKTQMELPAHILFTFEKVTKLTPNRTILVGTVTFNQTQINGDGIVIDFKKSTVKYHERGSRNDYSLEIDNRHKPTWESLLSELKAAIDARQY